MTSHEEAPSQLTIVFGTLGFTPRKLLPSVTSQEDVKRLVFYHDTHEESRAAAKRVRAFCHERGLDVQGVELDAFDIIQCAVRIRRDLRDAADESVVFNITGGTPVISSAATLACILEGVRAVYVDERDWREVSLPLLSIRHEDILNPEQRRVLRFIAGYASGCTQADVARGLGLARGTVSHHVRRLKEKHLVRAEPDPADARKEALSVMESAELLLEAPGVVE